MLIGAITGIIINNGFTYFLDKSSENVTDYFFFYAMPQLVTGLIVYGPLPVLCTWIGLIQKKEERLLKGSIALSIATIQESS